MSDPTTLAKTARESLARGLAALQSPGLPPALGDVAEPVAAAMSALHRIEASGGAALREAGGAALEAVRRALALLQAQAGSGHAAIDQATEAVAGSLGLVHSLSAMQPGAAAPARGGPGGTVMMDDGAPPAPAAMPHVQQPVAQAQMPQMQQAPQQAQMPQMQQPAAHAPMPHMQAPQYQAPQAAMPHMHAPQQHQPQAPAAQAPQAPQPAPGWGAPPVAAPPAHNPYGPPQAPAPQQQQAPWQQPQQAWPQQPQAQPVGSHPQAAGSHPHAAPAAQSGPKAAPAPAEPIQAPPGTKRIEAELGAHSPSNFYKGLSGNDVIDSGGIFVATYQIPKLGETIVVRVSMPGGYEFEALAKVEWSREAPSSIAGGGIEAPPGFGAKFAQISPEGRQLVYRYVRNREPLFHDDL